MSPSRKMGRIAAGTLLLMVGTVSSQGVLLPPIGSVPRPTVRGSLPENKPPASALPMNGEKSPNPAPMEKPSDELPKPRPTTEKLRPPELGVSDKPGSPVGQETTSQPLLPAEVLASVDRHYPLVRAAEIERVVAAGQAMAAQGSFDVVVKSNQNYVGDTFDSQRYGLSVEQLTPFHGLSYYAGYRLGTGEYPTYYGYQKTGTAGELRAGMSLPLLRNRQIDSARAGVAKANIDQALAEPNIQLARIDIAKAATQAYWAWVAAGQRYLITRDVLRIAQERNENLGKRVQAGNLPEIEQQDNKRIIIERQARLILAERGYQRAAILLSLYLRDEQGAPRIPLTTRLPAFREPPPPPTMEARLRDFEEALLRRPEIQRLVLQRRKIQVDLDLANNQTLPGLSLGLAGAQDYGKVKKDLFKLYGEVSLLFDVPLQRRNAHGRILAGRAELARLLSQEQFARDRVQIEVQNALNGLDRAYDLLRKGKDNRLQARYLEQAERRQFDVGKSDLFRVNIRELTTAEARFLEIDAVTEFYRALADYYAALGLDPSREPAGPTSPQVVVNEGQGTPRR